MPFNQMSGYDTKNVDSKYEQHTEEKKGREREKRNRKEERGGESSREKNDQIQCRNLFCS